MRDRNAIQDHKIDTGTIWIRDSSRMGLGLVLEWQDAGRSSCPYWRRDIQQQLIRLLQRELVWAVIGNKWRQRLTDSCMSFTTEYSQRLSLDKAKNMKALEDSVYRAVVGCIH